MRPGERRGVHRRQRGVGLIALLLLVAAASAAAALVAADWTRQAQRDKEAELLRTGDLYAQAIASYYFSSPGGAWRYPGSLDDLLEDRRFPTVRRHIRQLYPDPISQGRWGLVQAPAGGIMGVYSPSERAPLRRVPTPLTHTDLPAATRYLDWKFIPRSS